MTEPAHKTAERAPAARGSPAPAHAAEAPITLLEQAPEVSAEGRGEPAVRRSAILSDPRLLQRMGADQRARLVRQIQRGQGNSHVARALAQAQVANQSASVGKSVEERQAPDDLTSSEPPIGQAHQASPASTPETQAAQRTESPVQRNFFGDIVGAVTDPRKALLGKAADFAKSIPGYTMLTVILGKDPISGREVERNSKNLFHAVLGMVPGGEKLFTSLDESGAIDKAFAWLEQQFVQLGLNFNTIKGLFTRAWDSLSAGDLLHPIDAFEKLKGIFIEPITRLKNFVVAIGEKVLEFIFEGVMAKIGGAQVLSMLQRAGGAFQQIIKDPIGFLSNLLSGVKQGFVNFGKNILTHLGKGIMTWLFGELAAGGIELPKSFDLKGILSLVMQVLGLTWTSLRAQAVKMFGEKTVARLESGAEAGFKIFKIITEQGIGGLWEFIKEQIGNLKAMVLDGIKELVTSQIVQAGIQWLIGILGGPAGALVKAVQTIYNVVMWFVDNASRLAELISSIGESISAIASGAIGQAAKFIETALGNSVPVLLGLLAKLLGLGNLSQKIKGVIEKVQAPIKKATGWVLDKAKGFAAKIIGGGKGAFGKKDERTAEQKQAAVKQALDDSDKILSQNGATPASIKSKLPSIKSKYKLDTLNLVKAEGAKYHVTGLISRENTKDVTLAGATITIKAPKVLDDPKLSPTERAMALKAWNFKKASLSRAASNGELRYTPDTEDIRIAELQREYRELVAARYRRMYGKEPDLSKLNADHPVDLCVGGAADQCLKLIHSRVNKSVGASLAQACRAAGLKPGDPISKIEFNG